jgi:hypothetical protein
MHAHTILTHQGRFSHTTPHLHHTYAALPTPTCVAISSHARARVGPIASLMRGKVSFSHVQAVVACGQRDPATRSQRLHRHSGVERRDCLIQRLHSLRHALARLTRNTELLAGVEGTHAFHLLCEAVRCATRHVHVLQHLGVERTQIVQVRLRLSLSLRMRVVRWSGWFVLRERLVLLRWVRLRLGLLMLLRKGMWMSMVLTTTTTTTTTTVTTVRRGARGTRVLRRQMGSGRCRSRCVTHRSEKGRVTHVHGTCDTVSVGGRRGGRCT